MNQPTAILIGAAMISVAVLIATTSSPQAQFGSGAGRYMILQGDGGIFRLDTSTGELRYCRALHLVGTREEGTVTWGGCSIAFTTASPGEPTVPTAPPSR